MNSFVRFFVVSGLLVCTQIESKWWSFSTAAQRCAISSFVIGLAHGFCNQWFNNQEKGTREQSYRPQFHEVVSNGIFFTSNEAMMQEIIENSPWSDDETWSQRIVFSKYISQLFHGCGQMLGEAMPFATDGKWNRPILNTSLVVFLWRGAAAFLNKV